MKILIDNGHGEDTPGKRSPDGKVREYLYAREIAEAIERELKTKGYDAERIVKETIDVTLEKRVRRVNEVCERLGTSNVVFISIHCNGVLLVVGVRTPPKARLRAMNSQLCCMRKQQRIFRDK